MCSNPVSEYPADILFLYSTDVLKQLNYELLANYANMDPPSTVPPPNWPVMVLNNSIPWRGCVEAAANPVFEPTRVQIAIWDIGISVEVDLRQIRLIGSRLIEGRFIPSSMAEKAKILNREAAFRRFRVKTDSVKGLKSLDGFWNKFSIGQDGKLSFSENDAQVVGILYDNQII